MKKLLPAILLLTTLFPATSFHALSLLLHIGDAVAHEHIAEHHHESLSQHDQELSLGHEPSDQIHDDPDIQHQHKAGDPFHTHQLPCASLLTVFVISGALEVFYRAVAKADQPPLSLLSLQAAERYPGTLLRPPIS